MEPPSFCRRTPLYKCQGGSSEEPALQTSRACEKTQ
jgi:hypothetical protein